MSYYLGIDLGGTNIVAGVARDTADGGYELMNKFRLPTVLTRSFGEIVASMAEAGRGAVREAGISESDIDYVGMGVPSNIEPETRRVVFANNLGWRMVDVAAEFRKHWDIPVHLANDADCAALGEYIAGAAKPYSSVLLITLGTGVGGGMVVDGKLFLGGDGLGIEPGHGTLIYKGFPCTCGREGCLEAYASVTALVRETIDMMTVFPHSQMWAECGRDMDKVNGRTAFDAARAGDEPAMRVVQQYISYLGYGLSSLHTLYRPDVILIGGGVSNEGEYLMQPLREIVADTMHAKGLVSPPDIMKAQLGNDAGIIGAALLGLQ